MPGDTSAGLVGNKLQDDFCASAEGDQAALNRLSEEVLNYLQDGNISPDFAMQIENSGFTVSDSKVWNKGKPDPLLSGKTWQGKPKVEVEILTDCQDAEVTGKIRGEELARAAAAGVAAAIAVDIEVGAVGKSQKNESRKIHAERAISKNQ